MNPVNKQRRTVQSYNSIDNVKNRREETKKFYAHTKPSGTFFPHAFISKVRAIGILTLITPSTLALIAVHKHNAASRSARPAISVQHSLLGGVPITSWTNPNQLPQTPNLSVSSGHLEGFFGTEGGDGVVLGGGQGTTLWDETQVKNKMLIKTKRAAALQPLNAIVFTRNELKVSTWNAQEIYGEYFVG